MNSIMWREFIEGLSHLRLTSWSVGNITKLLHCVLNWGYCQLNVTKKKSWGWVMLETGWSCLISVLGFLHIHDLNYWKRAILNGYSESFQHEVSLEFFPWICPDDVIRTTTTNKQACLKAIMSNLVRLSLRGPQSVSYSSHHGDDLSTGGLWRFYSEDFSSCDVN